ncbi:LLM class flavin-dependent oxidoreductase (plasmid) [Agrobacterium leguminum]|uniref:LLM class flavin-dependent oxidoreductase n=1 Tax=Agrobacterium leguminum TaxID=2792015 RepID=UPI002729C76D|nr:LLM class flavin-dependent oxidoreductase [Agrobacterium leguminum]WLE00594.1 LLM class flavin-dependent oxidoreductase [Agrobacterium leguminum]
MQLGMFMQPIHDPARLTVTEMFAQDREAALYIDKLGFDEIFVGEHYTAEFEPIPNPLQFLASIMAETKMKLGTGVINMPIHHPAQLAGDIALLDHLSKGRVIMGCGPGATATDFELFGSLGKNSMEMLVESVDMIREIWRTDPPYRIKGKYWEAKVDDMVNRSLGFGPILKPYQQPFPPVLVSIMSANSKSAQLAGEKGWQILSANFAQAKWVKTHWEQYVIGCEKAGRLPDRQDWRIARSILVADTDQEAADYLAGEGNSHRYYYGLQMSVMKTYGIAGALKGDEAMTDDDLTLDYCLDTMVLSGSPKTVLEKLIDFVDTVGGPFGGLTLCFKEWDDPDIHKKSLRLLAEDVMPGLRRYCSQRIAAE